MKLQVKAWLGLCGTVLLAGTWFGACGGTDTVDDGSGTAFCGDGRVEGTEQCDDGNINENDGCNNLCQKSTCGDGVVDDGEDCDDGNDKDDDDCANDCTDGSSTSSNPTSSGPGNNPDCGNGEPNDGEFCDDGNEVNDDECPNDCSEPVCGDGITQAHLGEDCDDGIMSENDMCPDDCKDPVTSAGGMDIVDCDKQLIFHSVVSNPMDPNAVAAGVGSLPVWAYGGDIGVAAGDAMCKARGAHHACKYRELDAALKKNELDSAENQTKLGIANGPKDFWLHRVSETVMIDSNGGYDANGTSTPPGAGGRCNDWTYPTGHIAKGEYVDLTKDGNNATVPTYHFDQDTKYTGVGSDGHQGSPGSMGGPNGTGDVGANANGGPCSSQKRDILCCYKECIPQP